MQQQMSRDSPFDSEMENDRSKIEGKLKNQFKEKGRSKYECFCQKIYQSYPALYLHLKNKHSEYFNSSKLKKGQKKSQPTKLVETFDKQQGVRVYRIATDKIKNTSHHRQRQSCVHYERLGPPTHQINKFQPISSSSMNEEGSLLNIEQTFHRIMKKIKLSCIRKSYDFQLLLLLLADCLNKNYTILQDPRTKDKQVTRYTEEFDEKYVKNIYNYFSQVYLKQLRPTPSFQFFFQNSRLLRNIQEFYEQLNGFFEQYSQQKLPESIKDPVKQENSLSKIDQEKL